MKYALYKIFMILILGVMFVHGASTSASTTFSLSQGFENIFYFREGAEARKSLFNNYEHIDVLAPQSYSIDAYGVLNGEVDEEILRFADDKSIKVMPLVTNKGFSREIAHGFLNSKTAQDKAIKSLVKEAKKKGYVGWQLDFEQINAEYKDKFSSFTKKFGKEMKKNKLVSSVAVIAKISDDPDDYKEGLWNKLIGVYDYSALASATDFISLMSYDDPVSRGPIARYSWLNEVVDYSLEKIPKDKISIGLAMYYWRYDTDSGKRLGIGGYKTMKERIDKYKMTKGYSDVEQAPFMKYSYQGGNYIIWYENSKSIAKKLDLAEEKGIKSFSAWALGLEYPDVFSVITKNSSGITRK